MKRSGIEIITFLKNANIFNGLDNKNIAWPIMDVFAGTEGLCEMAYVGENSDMKEELTLNIVNRVIAKMDNPTYIICFLSLNGMRSVKNKSIRQCGLIKLINRTEMRNIARFFLLTSPQYIFTKYVIIISTNVKVNAS